MSGWAGVILQQYVPVLGGAALLGCASASGEPVMTTMLQQGERKTALCQSQPPAAGHRQAVTMPLSLHAKQAPLQHSTPPNCTCCRSTAQQLLCA